MTISMIAVIGKNNELGKKGGLLWHLPNDLKFFKEVTSGSTVVMGKRTYYSLPKKLPNRRNVVLTLVDEEQPDDVEVVHSVGEVLNMFDQNEEIFIIGGASIYKQFIEFADKLYLTEVDACDSEADVFFPTFDKSNYDVKILGMNSDNDINYKHVLYKRIGKG